MKLGWIVPWDVNMCTVEPLLRGPPDERPTPQEMSLDNVNLFISTPDKRPPLLKGHFWHKRDGLTREVLLYVNMFPLSLHIHINGVPYLQLLFNFSSYLHDTFLVSSY